MKYFLIMLLIAVLISCNNNDGNMKEYYDDGLLKSEYYLTEGLMNGFYKEYYKNGNIKIETSFKEGKQHGETKAFYIGGSLEREIYLKDGVQQGIALFYYDNDGGLKERSEAVDGQKHGYLRGYYENGVLKECGDMHRGFNHGYWQYFDKEGRFLNAIMFNEGTTVKEFKDVISFKQYSDSEFIVFYPKDWVESGTDNGKSFMVKKKYDKPVKFIENINVLKMSNIELSLNDFVSSTNKDLANSYNTFKIERNNKVSFGGYESRQVISIVETNDLHLKVLSTYLKRDNYVYIITCVSREEYFKDNEDLFYMVTNSFRFTDI